MVKVFYFTEVDSTQDEAKKLILTGVELPFFVVADRQNKGRGRMGRRWISEDGGVWLTYALKPSRGMKPLFYNYGAALAVKDYIKSLGVDCTLRWPNDIFAEGAKLCGILSEGDFTGEDFSSLRLGVGLNVNNDIEKIEAPYPVTSLGRLLKRKMDIKKVRERIFNHLEEWLANPDRNRIIKEYKKDINIIERYVKIKIGKEQVEGFVEGIDDEGLLVLRDAKGKEREFKEMHIADGELYEG